MTTLTGHVNLNRKLDALEVLWGRLKCPRSLMTCPCTYDPKFVFKVSLIKKVVSLCNLLTASFIKVKLETSAGDYYQYWTLTAVVVSEVIVTHSVRDQQIMWSEIIPEFWLTLSTLSHWTCHFHTVSISLNCRRKHLSWTSPQPEKTEEKIIYLFFITDCFRF